jgi:hypothetical protein
VFEFNLGLVGREVPVGFAASVISFCFPSHCCLSRGVDVWDAAIEALGV